MNLNDRESGHSHAPHSSPQHSSPHGGHGGTTFEITDASVKLVVSSLVIIAVTLAITLAITVPIQKTLHNTTPQGQPPSPLAPGRVVPPSPQLEVHPWEELPDLRAQWNEVLDKGGKDANGLVHIPIDQAMDADVSHLAIAPNAPVGLTTPGGQGRNFAGSVNTMPPQYRQPQIRGEIRKNAQ